MEGKAVYICTRFSGKENNLEQTEAEETGRSKKVFQQDLV
jgi:hypothetical protein